MCDCNNKPYDSKIIETIKIESTEQWQDVKEKHSINIDFMPFFVIVTERKDGGLNIEII